MRFLDTLAEYGRNWPYAAVQIVLVAVFVTGFWYLVNALTRVDDHEEMMGRGNAAYTVSRLGLSAAQIVALLPTVSRPLERSTWSAWGNGLFWIAVEALFVVVVLLVSRALVDAAVLYRIDNLEQLRRGNLAVGVAEAGTYLAIGLVLNGAMTGSAPSAWLGFAATVVFAVLGLAVVVATCLLHMRVTRRYDLHGGIRDGRVSAGVELAGMMVALGFIVRVGAGGDFEDWGSSFAAFTATVVIAVPTLYAARWLVDKLIVRGLTIRTIQEQDRVVPAVLLSGFFGAVALPVAAIVATQL